MVAFYPFVLCLSSQTSTHGDLSLSSPYDTRLMTDVNVLYLRFPRYKKDKRLCMTMDVDKKIRIVQFENL